jgi:hypothetical protein
MASNSNRHGILGLPQRVRRSKVLRELHELIRLPPMKQSAGNPAQPEHRPVGKEARKTIQAKYRGGFVSRCLSGANILDIGYQCYFHDAVPIAPQAIGIDLNYPGYDGKTLPFKDESQNAVFSSHCREKIALDTIGKQRIGASFNGRPIDDKTQRGGGLHFFAPVSNLKFGLNTLEFVLTDTAGPAKDADHRHLGIAVRNVKLPCVPRPTGPIRETRGPWNAVAHFFRRI